MDWPFPTCRNDFREHGSCVRVAQMRLAFGSRAGAICRVCVPDWRYAWAFGWIPKMGSAWASASPNGRCCKLPVCTCANRGAKLHCGISGDKSRDASQDSWTGQGWPSRPGLAEPADTKSNGWYGTLRRLPTMDKVDGGRCIHVRRDR